MPKSKPAEVWPEGVPLDEETLRTAVVALAYASGYDYGSYARDALDSLYGMGFDTTSVRALLGKLISADHVDHDGHIWSERYHALVAKLGFLKAEVEVA